jgi:uncharacterized protein (TIGR03435 family)
MPCPLPFRQVNLFDISGGGMKRSRNRVWSTFLILVGLSLFARIMADAQMAPLTFDVASVKQDVADETSVPPHSNFPIGSDDAFYDTGGVFSAKNLILDSYLIFAFKINNNNRQALMDSLPEWVKSERYDIEARTDLKAVSKDQMRLMMQALLRERFGLVARTETRVVPVYAAVLKAGGMGPQLREHLGKDCPPSTAKLTFDARGFPEVCGRFVNNIPSDVPHHRRFGGGDQPIATIVRSFSAVGGLDRPVVDRTSLQGKYDFVLDYLPDPSPGGHPADDAPGPDFLGALSSELGVSLVKDKAPIDFVTVSHIERPTAN